MIKILENRAKKNLFFFEMILGISILLGSMAFMIFGEKSLDMISAGGYISGLLLLGIVSRIASKVEESVEKEKKDARVMKALIKKAQNKGRVQRAIIRRERNPEIIGRAAAKAVPQKNLSFVSAKTFKNSRLENAEKKFELKHQN